MQIHKLFKAFYKSVSGIAATEFAIILPVMLLLFFAIFEFGLYFTKYQVGTRTANDISYKIQRNPTDTSIKNEAETSGLSFIDMATLPNYVCAQSYKSEALAKAGSCSHGQWDTSPPAGLTGDATYYVIFRTYVDHDPITPITAWLSDIDIPTTVQVSTPKYILASGDGNFSGWNGNLISFYLAKPGMLNFHCYSRADDPGFHGMDEEGILVQAYVDGAACSIDNNWTNSVNANYYSNVVCVKRLGAETTHTIQCKSERFGQGMKTIPAGGHFGYVVILSP